MRFPIHITTDQVGYQIRKAAAGETRYPLVLMLEPLYTCNLACVGCSTERHTGKLSDRLPLETCLRALDECGAPTVSICGGEPTLYPELAELLAAIIERKKHIYLCTNGLVLDTKVFGKIAPHKRLTINVHLDGMRETHDKVCDARGRVRQGDRDDQGGQAARLPRHHQHHRLQGDVGRGDRGALQAGQEPGRRRAARLAGLPLRVGEGRTSS